MNPETFQIFVHIVETDIRKKYTSFRQAVSVKRYFLLH